ncbi:hypothetical protein JCM3774_004615 [Rhodotorula dairenensis]
MGEPPLLLHDWFAAVAPSTLAGDRELAIVLYGRVEAGPGVVDDRPSALQLVKRLGNDAFRTGAADEARTVKLVGLLARERAVAAGVDEVVMNTFKTGISPHYEFLLRAAREQKPHKVNLRAAFPPRPRPAAAETTPAKAPGPSRDPRPVAPTRLDLGSGYQRPAGAPGSMHELAQGLRRARQLRRPISAQRAAEHTLEPRVLPDRDAGWTSSAELPIGRREDAPDIAAAQADPAPSQPVNGPPPFPEDTSMLENVLEEPEQPTNRGQVAEPGAAHPIEVGDDHIPRPSGPQHDDTVNEREVPRTATDEPPAPTSLIQIDCRPKSVKQALALTVWRFFLDPRSDAKPNPSSSAPPSVTRQAPSRCAGPVKVDRAAAHPGATRPRRRSEPVSRFQANMASMLSLSKKLSNQATEELTRERTPAPSLAGEQAFPEIDDDATQRRDEQPEAAAAGQLEQETTVSMVEDHEPGDQGRAATVAEQEDVDMYTASEASPEQVEAGAGELEQNPEIEKVASQVADTGPAEADVSVDKPRPVSLSRMESSSDRHSSLDPMPIRSSQAFSSMYSDDSGHEDDHDSTDATAHEISAFLERDLASSAVDEEDFAGRSERPNVAIEQPREISPVVHATVQAVASSSTAPSAEDLPIKISPPLAIGAPRSPPSPAPANRLGQEAAAPLAPTVDASTRSVTPIQADAPATAAVAGPVPEQEARQEVEVSSRPDAQEQAQTPPPAPPLQHMMSSPPRLEEIAPQAVRQVTPKADEVPATAPETRQSSSPRRELVSQVGAATTPDPASETAARRPGEPARCETAEPAVVAASAAAQRDAWTTPEADAAVQHQQVEDDTYYAPLEDKGVYFADTSVGETRSVADLGEVKREDSFADGRSHHLAANASMSNFADVFHYQSGDLVHGGFTHSAVENVLVENPAGPYNLDDITDRGALEALAALRSSPAMSPGEETLAVQSGTSNLTKPRRPRPRTTSAPGQQQRSAASTPAKPASAVAALSSGTLLTKRRRRPVDDFILEIYPLKSPKSPSKRTSLEKRSGSATDAVVTGTSKAIRSEGPSDAPIASTSKVTLDRAPTRVPTPTASGASPHEPDLRASASVIVSDPHTPVDKSPAVPVGTTMSDRGVAEARPAANDYETDSDDPLAAPAPRARSRVSNGIPKQMAKRSRRLPDPSTQSGGDDSEDEAESRAIAQTLLTHGRARRSSSEFEAPGSRPTPPTKRRLSRGVQGEAPEPKRPRVTPPAGPHRRPSLAGKGQHLSRNGLVQDRALPNGSFGSPQRRHSVQDDLSGSAARSTSSARPSREAKGGEVRNGHAPQKRRHSDLIAMTIEDEGAKGGTPDRRSAVPAHPAAKETQSVSQSKRRRSEAGPPPRFVEPAMPPNGHSYDRGSSPAASSVGTGGNSYDGEENDGPQPQPIDEQLDDEPVEVQTPAKPRKRPKKRKPLNMPRYKGRKRVTPKPSRRRSPTPEDTASPEPTPTQPRPKVGQPSAKRKQKNSGGVFRGSSKRARQAYDEGEWEG